MPSSLEVEISRLLRESQKPEKVASELIKRWRSNLLSLPEQADCAQFLISCGFYPQLFKELRRLLNEGQTLPWAQVSELLGRTGQKPSKSEFAALFEGAEAQAALGEFFRSNQLDLFNREVAEKRTAYKKKRENDLQSRKQALKDQLAFIRANRLFSEEERLIREIQNLFPGEKDILEEAESFNIRWAKEVVSNSSGQSDYAALAADLKWRTDRLTPEQASAKSLIFERAKELAKSDTKLAYDLAMSLHMMEFHREALEVLENAKSPAADWLRLELMIHGRQFVSALDYATQLEIEHADDPESSFAVVFARARALYGLGQKEMAIDLLRSLLRIRPNYKSAQSLLTDWAGGDA